MLALTLQEFLPDAMREVRMRHALLRHVPAVEVNATRVVLAADVRDSCPQPASFEVPFSATRFMAQAPASADHDGEIKWLLSILRRAAKAYELASMRAVYSASGERFGFRQLLPSSVKPYVIGGIDEAVTPGWRSRRQVEVVRRGQPRLLDSVSLLARSCKATRSSAVVVGRNRWHQVIEEFSPQQIFIVSNDVTDPSIMFQGTRILPDSHCDPDDVFLVRPEDFAHIFGQFHVTIDQTLDEHALEVSVFRREQLATRRRYRSGTVSHTRVT